MLLQSGYQPRRTIHLAFGHDEEIGGKRGAVQIADFLQKQGVQPHFVLDEGMALTSGMIPNVAEDIAFTTAAPTP